MKIWIDLTNSPHVNFFSRMIRELEKDHEIILTCRPLANTIDLLNLEGFSYQVIGSHYGAGKVKKIIGFPIRVLKLVIFLFPQKVDVAISHSSFYSPVAARLLGVPNIYLNDNEYAAGNRISFLCADKIMIPEYLSTDHVIAQGAREDKVLRYPGVKEGVYLWHYCENKRSDSSYIFRNNRKNIFIRPEPWTAQYYSGRRNFLDELICGLMNKYNVILLPRGQEQRKYYTQSKFSSLIIPKTAIALKDIMNNCDLFIGAGGTMTREAAVLGIPTISVYQDDLLDVDKYLIKCGYMVHEKNPSVSFVESFMDGHRKCCACSDLLSKGREAYEQILRTLLLLGERRTGEKVC